MPLADSDLQKIYTWIDEIPLSRPKRNIARDFADGVLMAEVVNHYFPRLVEMHNYSQANSLRQKMYNWSTLNMKVFKKMGFQVETSTIELIVNCRPGAIESTLNLVQKKLAAYQLKQAKRKQAGGGATARSGGSVAASARSGGGAGGAGAGRASAGVGAAAPTTRSTGGDTGRAGPGAPGDPSSAAYFAAASAVDARVAGGAQAAAHRQDVDEELLVEKENTIQELQETIEIMELKIKKLEQLVRLKDSRIQTLTARIKSQQMSL